MAKIKRMILFACLWLFLLTGAATAETRRRALLVGCDHFITQVDTAPASFNNVKHMAETLSGGSMNLCSLVVREEGVTGMEELSQLVDEAFAGADENDVSYFYISTHGLWEDELPGGDMRFVLSDGFSEGNITAYELRALFDRVPGIKVLFLDACHSGSVIGKGSDRLLRNVFASPDYKILCSSGSEEESWFWSGRAANVRAGAGYFSGALVNGLSPSGGFGADSNRDGTVTLTELKRYLLANHGASTVQSYPEEDDFPLFVYSAADQAQRRREAAIDNVIFDEGALHAENPVICFAFTVLTDVRVAYQLVFQKDGRWDFEHTRLYWDNDEQYGAHGDVPGYLSPGYKEREISFTPSADDMAYGYVLFQLLTVSGHSTNVVSSRVLCVPPTEGDPQLSVETSSVFRCAPGDELSIIIRHAYPCELSVTIRDEDGNTVRRLSSRTPTRPQQLTPRGTTMVWNGLDSSGQPAAPGSYTVHVKAYLGNQVYEAQTQVLIPQGA